MKVSLKLPMFGMNMEEATVIQWHASPGDAFKKGAPLYEIETEKVTTQVEAPCDGVLLEIVADTDSIIKVGDVVCNIET